MLVCRTKECGTIFSMLLSDRNEHHSFLSVSVVDCGSPVVSPYFTTDYTGTLFGDNVDYECVEGYSLNPTDHSQKSSNAQCQANKTWSFTPNCQGERHAADTIKVLIEKSGIYTIAYL